jgi:uncharacterized protein (DUF305 family)
MMDRGAASPDAPESTAGTLDDADLAFVRDMIPHHRQAVAMTRLAVGRAQDPRILDLAERIEAAQQPEIETLSGLLDEWNADRGHMDDGVGGMNRGPGAMDGTMSPEDMHLLAAASGAEFDRLFLAQMIVHHEGAVEMAETEIIDGRNAEATALAESIRDNQRAEIAEMQQLLDEPGG